MEEIYKNLNLENLEGEIWLPIEGYEGLYEVSNMGRVKSLGNDKLRKEKILRQAKNDKNGYLQVNLCKDGKMKTCTVHRLVGNAFIDNPNNLPCFNHKDEDKTNNCVDNLEPCDHKYNLNYKNAQAKRVASIDWKSVGRKNAEKLSRQVYQYSQDGTLVGVWQSTAEAGRNGFNFGAVSACCNNKFNREGNNIYKGYIWSYTPIDTK